MVAHLDGAIKKLSPQDRQFPARYIPLFDSLFFDFLKDYGFKINIHAPKTVSTFRGAIRFERELGLSQKTGVDRAVSFAAARLYGQGKVNVEEGMQLAYFAARANVRITDDFHFLCEDGSWQPVQKVSWLMWIWHWSICRLGMQPADSLTSDINERRKSVTA